MKTKVMILIAILSVAVVTGCSSKNSKNEPDMGMSQRQQTTVTVSDEIKQNATKVVTGTVESIVGNEVTLLVSSENDGKSDSYQKNIASQLEQGSHPERAEMLNENGQRPQRNQGEGRQLPEGTTFPEGERSQRRRGDSQGSENTPDVTETSNLNIPANDSQRASADEKTAVYLLPVGMKIGSKDYSSVSAGNTLKIYFGTHPDDGSEIITAVEVANSRR